MIVLPELMGPAAAPVVSGTNGAWKSHKSTVRYIGSKVRMAKEGEERNYKRCHYEVPIWLTGFNKIDWVEAQMSNHCLEGMCFKSNTLFKLETMVLIRINYNGWTCSDASAFEGLRTITIGVVKWCKEIHHETAYGYVTGIKYLPPVY